MLLVLGRIRVVAVAVAVSDRSIFPVYDDFHVLSLRLRRRARNRCLLSINNYPCTLRALFFVAQPSLCGTT